MEFFSVIDWSAILKIVMIDIMLGADNAIVIALACAGLHPSLRTKAVVAGTVGAVMLRAILLVFATLLLDVMYLKVIAGVILIYIGYKLLLQNEKDHNVAGKTTLFGAMSTVIVADFWMSLDNVMAVAGAASGAGEHSTIYAVSGIVLSIPIIVFGASYIMKWMEKFPIITWIGAGMLGWVGAEMVVSDSMFTDVSSAQHLTAKILGAMIVVVPAYFITKFKKETK